VDIESEMLEWSGHVSRMVQTRVDKRIFEANQKIEEKWEDPD
jgi:hypothetical protein